MAPAPITSDRELLRRALAVGWRTVNYPDVGRRLVSPIELPAHLAAEATLIGPIIGQRLHALIALLNGPITQPSTDTAGPDHAPVASEMT